MDMQAVYIHTMECYSVIKRNKLLATKRHGGNLKGYCYVKEASMERLSTIWFQ